MSLPFCDSVLERLIWVSLPFEDTVLDRLTWVSLPCGDIFLERLTWVSLPCGDTVLKWMPWINLPCGDTILERLTWVSLPCGGNDIEWQPWVNITYTESLLCGDTVFERACYMERIPTRETTMWATCELSLRSLSLSSFLPAYLQVRLSTYLSFVHLSSFVAIWQKLYLLFICFFIPLCIYLWDAVWRI